MATERLNFQVTLRDERDKLLTEKASAPAASADGAASGTGDATELRLKFEAEKAELVKAREDALVRSKVCLVFSLLIYYDLMLDRLPKDAWPRH